MARGRSTGPGFEDLRRGALTSGDFAPVYLLVGEDQLRIEATVEAMKRKALDPAASAFNVHLMHGDQASWQQVLQTARAFPMFGGKQLVWVRNVDALGAGQDAADVAALSGYLDDPPESTILVLTGEKVDGRRAWVAAAKKKGYFFAFGPPQGRDLHAWIERAAQRAELELDRDALAVLVDLVGNDLRALQAEIDKLALVQENRGRPPRADELAELVMDQAELEVFRMTDEMADGLPAAVLQTWWRLQSWGSDAYSLTPMVVSHLRRVALIAAVLADGRDPQETAAAAKLNAWMVRNKLIPQAQRSGGGRGAALLRACLECERTQKGRPIPPDLAFERLLLAVAGQR